MRVGFIEVGRSMNMDPLRDGPVRPDAVNLFTALQQHAARNYTNMEFVVAGKNSAQASKKDPPVVECDRYVVWLNQHPAVSTPHAIPKLDGSGIVTPLEYAKNYVAYAWELVNSRPTTFVCNDPRSCLKAREVWNPQLVLGAYEMENSRQYFNGFEHVEVKDIYRYAGVEQIGLDDLMDADWRNEDRPIDLLCVANETRPGGPYDRAKLIREMMPEDGLVVGKWSEKGQQQLGRRVEPVDWKRMPELMRQTKYMLVLPTSGTGWATAKIWECYAAGVVPIVHPRYDSQRWTIPAPGLISTTCEEVNARAKHPVKPETREWLRGHYELAMRTRMFVSAIFDDILE